MKMTDKEYKLVCEELTERVKDTMSEFPHRKVFEQLNLLDTYTMTVVIVGADILQILGRIRRKVKK